MKIKVEQVALLKCRNVPENGVVELNSSATIGDLLNVIGIRPEHQKVIVPFINRNRAKRTSALEDGDEVFLSLAIGGG